MEDPDSDLQSPSPLPPWGGEGGTHTETEEGKGLAVWSLIIQKFSYLAGPSEFKSLLLT